MHTLAFRGSPGAPGDGARPHLLRAAAATSYSLSSTEGSKW